MQVLQEWVTGYINGDEGRAQLLCKAKTSSGLHNITSKIIGGLQIPTLSTSEHVEITKIIGTCDAKIAALEREAVVLEELFRAMLEELMTARVRADTRAE